MRATQQLLCAGGGDIQTETIGTRPLGKLTADQQEVVLQKRRLVASERKRVELATQLAAERRAASLTHATLGKSEQAVRTASPSVKKAMHAACAWCNACWVFHHVVYFAP